MTDDAPAVDGTAIVALPPLSETGALGDALAALCTSINPDAVVIGGDLGAACAPMRDAVERRIHDASLPPTGAIPVHPATLAGRAEVLGAITLALGQDDWLRDAGLIALTAPAAYAEAAG